MSYQHDRDEFIAHMTREGLPLRAIETLLRTATTIERLAELACSSEAADRDRIKCPAWAKYGRETSRMPENSKTPCLCDVDTDDGPNGEPVEVHTKIPRITLQDYHAEQRAIAAVPPDWRVLTSGDPRGFTLRVIPPSYAERNQGRDRFNLDAIGVPARPSNLRF